MARNADWAAYVSQRLKRPNGVILVAELNGELVGFVDLRVAGKGRPAAASNEGMLRRLLRGWRRNATADQSALVEPSSSGVIDDIYVVPQCRNRGIRIEQEVQMPLPAAVIHCDREILGGTPVSAGTRVPFRNLIDYLERNHGIDEFLDSFPTGSCCPAQNNSRLKASCLSRADARSRVNSGSARRALSRGSFTR